MSDVETPTTDNRASAAVWLAGIALGAVGLVGYVLWALDGNFVREGNWVGVDFHVYYQAARVLQRGGDIYSAGISPPYVYPPFLAALVVPIAGLPVNTATMLWKLLQHICLLTAGTLVVSLLPGRVRPLAAGALLLGLLTVPVRDEIQVGESNSVVLLLVVSAVWLIHLSENRGGSSDERWGGWSGASAGAGALLAVAASIKVLPVLLITYLWWRGPRSSAAIAAAGFAALQLLMLAITPSTVTYWLVEFPGLFGQAFPFLDNQSLNALISRATFPGGDPGTPPTQLVDGEAIRPALTWLANGLALLAAAWVLYLSSRRVKPGTRNEVLLLQVGIVLLTTHLVSGSTWLHHLVDLCVPILGLVWAGAAYHRTRGRVLTMANAASLAVVALLFVVLRVHPVDWVNLAARSAPGSNLLAFLAADLPVFMVAALWLRVAAALLRTRATEA